MRSTKTFIDQSFKQDPERFGKDDGDLNIVNALFIKEGYATITREQFSLCSGGIRARNKYLEDNPHHDFRTEKSIKSRYTQQSLFDYIDRPQHFKTLTAFFAEDINRYDLKNKDIADLAGVPIDSVVAFGEMPNLFMHVPELKPILKKDEIKKDEVGI